MTLVEKEKKKKVDFLFVCFVLFGLVWFGFVFVLFLLEHTKKWQLLLFK